METLNWQTETSYFSHTNDSPICFTGVIPDMHSLHLWAWIFFHMFEVKFHIFFINCLFYLKSFGTLSLNSWGVFEIQFSFCLDVYLEVGLLNHMVVLFLTSFYFLHCTHSLITYTKILITLPLNSAASFIIYQFPLCTWVFHNFLLYIHIYIIEKIYIVESIYIYTYMKISSIQLHFCFVGGFFAVQNLFILR